MASRTFQTESRTKKDPNSIIINERPHTMPTTYFILIGAVGTGKTTLSRAILESAQEKAPGARVRDATFNKTLRDTPGRRYAKTRFRGTRAVYSMIDPWDSFISVETALLHNREPADIGIYVVNAELGPRKEDGFALEAFGQLRANRVVLFITHAENMDRQAVEGVIAASRRFLGEFGFVRGDIKEVVGSAEWALKGRDDRLMGTSAIERLLVILDNAFPR